MPADNVFHEVVRMQDAGEPGVLAVVTAVEGHTPQVVGARMIVRPDGSLVGTIGGGRVEQVVVEGALEVLAEGKPRSQTWRLKAELGMCCGGQMTVFLAPLEVPLRLWLFGAGHVAKPTAALAARCGFRVTVIDDRPDWNTEERFPDAAERLVRPHQDFCAEAAWGARDYVVAATPNHDHDRDVLGAALRTPAAYAGMIGSIRKCRLTFQQLRLEGLTDADLERAHAPIGLDILAETPDELALAIVGELVRHRREAQSTKTTRGAPVRLLSEAPEAPDPSIREAS